MLALGEFLGQGEDQGYANQPAATQDGVPGRPAQRSEAITLVMLRAIGNGTDCPATLAQLLYPGVRNSSDRVRAMIAKARRAGLLCAGNPLRLSATGSAAMVTMVVGCDPTP